MQAGPLSGITIVDLSRILAGPYCTLLAAELGARVIKVEAPKTGDDARQYGPFKGGKSTYFASVNRGKESIVLDIKRQADSALLRRMVARADVFVDVRPAPWHTGTPDRVLYATIAHEMGHALGLPHDPSPAALMHPSPLVTRVTVADRARLETLLSGR